MMGIVILLAGVAGLALSLLLGTAGVSIYRKALASSGGAGPFFWSAAAIVAMLVIGAGAALLWNARSAPPAAEDFVKVMKALFLFGAAPGIGMLTAALAGLAIR